MKALIDTNVIVDALTSREPWKESVEKIFLMDANQVMGKLYSLMGILAVTGDECMDALTSAVVDYEDAVIERTAVKTEMDCIITRNVKDYQDGMVKAILPDDFIALMEGGE